MFIFISYLLLMKLEKYIIVKDQPQDAIDKEALGEFDATDQEACEGECNEYQDCNAYTYTTSSNQNNCKLYEFFNNDMVKWKHMDDDQHKIHGFKKHHGYQLIRDKPKYYMNNKPINWSFKQNSEMCQQHCDSNNDCKSFTYYTIGSNNNMNCKIMNNDTNGLDWKISDDPIHINSRIHGIKR